MGFLSNNQPNFYYNKKDKDLNLFNLYLKEINKYPLLTKEEEIKIGEDLLLINNIDPFFIKKDTNEYKYSLNYQNILFTINLDKNMDYEIVIDTIIDYLSKQDNEKDKSSLKLMEKYRDISKKLNRALNDEELKEYFKISYDKKRWGYSSSEIIRNIKLFIMYSNAYKELYNSNLRLVVSVANNFNTSTNILDLVAEGNIGLMRAVEKFDIRLGNKFSTYAVWWIKHEINNCIYDNKFIIRIPRNFYNEISVFYKKVKELENKYCKKLSILEISKELNMTIDEVIRYLNFSRDTISIEHKTNENSDTELGDFMYDEFTFEDKVFKNQLKKDIKILFSTLSEKELDIIKLRNGITKSGRSYTLKEIADDLGVTRERIRQIEFKAMRKMILLTKTNTKCKELKEYIK